MKAHLKSALLIATIILGTGLSCIVFTSCEQRPNTLGEKIDDALDNRPNEKLKDAGENAADAIEDAAESVKDAVKDATN